MGAPQIVEPGCSLRTRPIQGANGASKDEASNGPPECRRAETRSARTVHTAVEAFFEVNEHEEDRAGRTPLSRSRWSRPGLGAAEA